MPKRKSWNTNPLRNTILVGTYVPTAFAEVLQLAALSQSSTTSELVRSILRSSVPTSKESIQTMVNGIARTIYSQWANVKMKNRPDFSTFCMEVKSNHLKKYRISQFNINQIMSEVRKLHEKNSVSNTK